MRWWFYSHGQDGVRGRPKAAAKTGTRVPASYHIAQPIWLQDDNPTTCNDHTIRFRRKHNHSDEYGCSSVTLEANPAKRDTYSNEQGIFIPSVDRYNEDNEHHERSNTRPLLERMPPNIPA
ncbi:hypothetical protein HanPSC8_Chr05g0216371 [Helianthus annuus]|nr:hypothetical protein HanPSC8_Chr05g0216371 [Helianthus annuus]